MQWEKLGVVWKPDGSLPWARSHASCPTPVRLRDGTLRVFVQSRDANNVGRVGYVDLDPDNPRRVLNVSRTPVLDVGEPGTFDHSGMLQTSVVPMPDGRLFLYYVGFELCHSIRYRLLTGLAVSEDGGDTFRRVRPTPILERSPTELYFRGGPHVLRENGRFRMWYVAGSTWEEIDGKSMPVYELRYIESENGIDWPDSGRLVFSFHNDNEHGLGRPVVYHDPDGYRMYYSIRRRNPARYGIGYAISQNGLAWERKDHLAGIDVSPDGWDAQSVEFGFEIEAGGHTWLLYNGNDFGGTGFGIARRVVP
ncbi:hypothetical protein [Paludibacterium paludis]|uniref:Glycosyl hydrolase family 32 n=1 Tax=Paludibacterium paludis TaxID=1225769 RepID=A0A918UBA2_9NEIS|nr:hypothetical protein [Paludibacterium paludis]GGY27978.1 hypothetical protein GCM10011289_34160 [Paludibacterium paludis]